MAAIVKTESGFKPFSIGINKSQVKLVRQPANKQEAVTTAKWLISNGYNIDMGMAQINSANMKRLGVSVEDLFDPCKNVSAGAKILLNNYVDAFKKIGEPQNALRAALSSYNTGNATAGIKNGYVAKVTAASVTVPALLALAPKPLNKRLPSHWCPSCPPLRPQQMSAAPRPINRNLASIWWPLRQSPCLLLPGPQPAPARVNLSIQ